MNPCLWQPSPTAPTNENRPGEACSAPGCTNHKINGFSISSFGAKRRLCRRRSGRGCPPLTRWARPERGQRCLAGGRSVVGRGTHASPWRGRDQAHQSRRAWATWERWFVQFVLREFTTPCARRPAFGRLFSSFCTISTLVPQPGTPNREPGTDLNTSFCRKRATSPTFRSWVATLLDGPTRPPTFTLPFAAPGCTHCPHLP